jgi:hypothetical protein
MKKMAFRTMAAVFLVLSTNGLASADIIFNVNASLQYGGTLSGTLTFASPTSLGTVEAWDLVASAGPGSPGFTFPGFTYTSSTSSVTAESSTLIQFDSTPAGQELRLTFTSALTASGATLATTGYESEIVAGNRSIVSGSVVPAPEPSTAVLVVLGVTLGGGGMWYRRKRSA